MEHGETFSGMSSDNQYWNSSSDSYSDDSSNSLLSCIKEYRDAACSADFDEELDEIIDEHEENIEKISTKIDHLTLSPIDKIVRSKSARYVRWDVLMSLGIGLWIILCIVDLLHTENSLTRDWLFEFMRGKKNPTKTESIKKPTDDFSFWSFLPYLWKILSISGASCIYILLFLLIIVFCADSRLRKSTNSIVAKNDLNEKISIPKTPEKKLTNQEKKLEIVEKNDLNDKIWIPKNPEKKLTNREKKSEIVESFRKIEPVKFESSPAIYVHARILSSTDERIVSNITKLQTLEQNIHRSEILNISKILNASCQTEYRYQFGVNKSILTRLDIAGSTTIKFTNLKKPEWHSIVSSYPTDSHYDTFAVRTFSLKIKEYTRMKKKSWNDIDDETFENSQTIKTSRVCTESLSNDKINTKIITSSPAFKTFLSRLKPKEAPALTAPPKLFFRNHVQNI